MACADVGQWVIVDVCGRPAAIWDSWVSVVGGGGGGRLF